MIYTVFQVHLLDVSEVELTFVVVPIRTASAEERCSVNVCVNIMMCFSMPGFSFSFMLFSASSYFYGNQFHTETDQPTAGADPPVGISIHVFPPLPDFQMSAFFFISCLIFF